MQVSSEWVDLLLEYLCNGNPEKRSKLRQKEDYIIDFSSSPNKNKSIWNKMCFLERAKQNEI